MSEARLLWQDYRYFPYEKVLAQREVTALCGQIPTPSDSGFEVEFSAERQESDCWNRLTYFKGVETDKGVVVPKQARLEASALTNGQTWFPEIQPFPHLRRQSSRYSAHGLHEYRGKFNPQMVTVIGNIIGLNPGDWVIDPFCGSGTTLLEAAHNGWNAIGSDINPLGVLIANAKIAAFRCPPQLLKDTTNVLVAKLQVTDDKSGLDWSDYLPNSVYLSQWFTPPVLQQFTRILKTINESETRELHPVYHAALSDICRDVSLQDPEDLRIRRRKPPYPDFNPIADFCTTLTTKMETVRRARETVNVNAARQSAFLADSREMNEAAVMTLQASGRRHVDAAITSPPYATALPYIDTQRLSLCLLGLISSSEIRGTERALIGNREIGDSERADLEKRLLANDAELPSDVMEFCRHLLHAATDDSHGFRRRNVPALAYKYFAQMAETFAAVGGLVRQDGWYALVVGGNKTTLKGQEIIIDTPALLAKIAASQGWEVKEAIPLETYPRYNIHQKNSIRTETLLLLKNRSKD